MLPDILGSPHRELQQGDCDGALYAQGVMPRGKKYAARIHALNAAYREMAGKFSATFIDLFPVFDDGTGVMDSRDSLDCRHLTGPGYVRWREVLAPHLQCVMPGSERLARS